MPLFPHLPLEDVAVVDESCRESLHGVLVELGQLLLEQQSSLGVFLGHPGGRRGDREEGHQGGFSLGKGEMVN